MKLKKLILKNYKQHAFKEITFEGNIIGVIGPNGSGKSNLLGALHFALAGEQPGFNKSDLLRWGEAEGSVELHFDHNGIACEIARSLHSAAVYFKHGNDETTGSKKVEERVSVLLGMDKDLLKQAIFVRQAEIDAILFTDPRVRELSFQKLCGIGDAAKIHKKMGDELTLLAVPPNYDEQIAEATKRYKDTVDRCATLKTQASTMQATRAQCPQYEQMQNVLTSQEQLGFSLDRLIKLDYDKTIMSLGISQDEATLAGLNVPNVDINELDKQISNYQDLLNQAQTYHRALKTFEESGNAVVALGKQPEKPPLPFTDQQLEALKIAADDFKSKFNQAHSDMMLYDGLKKAVEGKGLSTGVECPVCGNAITDTERLSRKLAECRQVFEVARDTTYKATVEFSDASNKNGEIARKTEQAITTYQTQFAYLVKQYKQAEQILNSTKRVDEDVNAVMQMLNQALELRKQALAGSSMRTSLLSKIKTNKEHLGTVLVDWSAATNTVMADPAVAKEVAEGHTLSAIKESISSRLIGLKTSLGQIQQLDQNLAQLNGMIQELEKIIKDLENTISKLEFKRSQQDEYRAALKVLNDVRDWFHYSNGPHTLASAVLSDMVADINAFLEEFAAPFTVISSDDAMGFKYIMHDGSAMPDTPPDAMHLSGGQRIQLAIAFRFAAYCMFANKLGILSLDEPSCYLDDYHVGRFGALLVKIKQVAQKMNLQVLIATHEQSLLPFCDTVMDLNPEPNIVT